MDKVHPQKKTCNGPNTFYVLVVFGEVAHMQRSV